MRKVCYNHAVQSFRNGQGPRGRFRETRKEFYLMTVTDIVALAGGLALLLYGMSIMGTGLEKMSGSHLERVLERLTSNRFLGFLLGIGVTAIIQSSSATTVMVVGFVNSGIMKLSQSVGVIMGANIGTTVTAWILSLTGIQGDSLALSLLKPDSLAPICAFAGIILFLFIKRRKSNDLGSVLLGFALLLFGMTMMSSAVEPLQNEPWFAKMFTLFTNPFLGVLVGAVLTAIIQSSSASVGVLQAMSASGMIRFSAVIPIICGQNIGTCVTALLSCGGATRNAKRAAVIHLLFNIIGTAAFLLLFYLAKAFISMPFLTETASAADIALVHTAFNVFTTALLFPFSNLLVKLSDRLIPEKKEAEELELLDERLLSTPSFAVERCHTLTVKMADLTGETMRSAISLLTAYDEKKARFIQESENMADVYEDRLGDYLVRLSGHELSEHDTQTVSLLLSAIGDFERICDHAVNLLEASEEMHEKNIAFSEDAKAEMAVMTDAVSHILTNALNAFVTGDPQLASSVEPLEEVIDDLRAELKNRHIVRLREGRCTVELGFILSDVLTNCERISDHCSNIAVAVLNATGTELISHTYLTELKHTSQAFSDAYEAEHKRYFERLGVLPE